VPQALNNFMTNSKIHNTSGYIGVSWHKVNASWVAQITVDSKRKYIGSYKSKRDAYIAYSSERKKQVTLWRNKMDNVLPTRVIDNIK